MLKQKSQKVLGSRLKLLKIKDEMQGTFLSIADHIEDKDLKKTEDGSRLYSELGRSVEDIYKNLIAAEEELESAFKLIRSLSDLGRREGRNSD